MTGAAPDLLARFVAIGLATVALFCIAFFGGCAINMAPRAFGSLGGREDQAFAALLLILSLGVVVNGVLLLVMAVKMFRGKV